MKKLCLLALLMALTISVGAQAQSSSLSEVTLYSPIKHDPNSNVIHFNFDAGAFVPADWRWDLTYGALYVREEHDWFRVQANKDSRSIIKDLGALSWTDAFKVPIVEPFPRLKMDQARMITIDASGADAVDAKPGALKGPKVNSEEAVLRTPSAFDMPPQVEVPWLARPRSAPSAPPVRREKRDGKPKIDPIFIKAIVGHMYVIHVVEGDADYYALFRVESLERGDHCSITWKMIPAPEDKGRN